MQRMECNFQRERSSLFGCGTCASFVLIPVSFAYCKYQAMTCGIRDRYQLVPSVDCGNVRSYGRGFYPVAFIKIPKLSAHCSRVCW